MSIELVSGQPGRRARLPRLPRLPRRARQAARAPRSGWPVAGALLGLSIVPLAAGSLRLVQLAGGPAILPAEERFADSPLPLVVHIVAAAAYAVLGAFQLVPGLRRRRPAWHRRAGRVAVVAGVLVAGSALTLTVQYAPEPGTTTLLYTLRLAFGSAMAASLALGVRSIRRGDVAQHRAWMIRAYAIALAAGTQALTEGLGSALLGTGGLRGDLAKAAGWVINVAVAEWVIRRQPDLARRRSPRGHRTVAAARPGARR